MSTIIHFTLNTGHSRVSPRSEVGDDIIAMLAPLTTPGEHVHRLPPGYRIVVPESPAGLVATVFRGATPITTFGAAATDADAGVVWAALEYLVNSPAAMQFHGEDGAPRHGRPDSLPWVAAVVLRGVGHDDTVWLADFERCLAWAWLERRASLNLELETEG